MNASKPAKPWPFNPNYAPVDCVEAYADLLAERAELMEALSNLLKWAEVYGPVSASGEWIATGDARALLRKIENK